MHRPTVSEIEAGRRSVTSEELLALSRVLSAPVSHLLPSASGEHPEGIDALILEMARVIAERFQPRQIILFGSHARGTAGPDSDVDFLVVMDMDSGGSRRRVGAQIGAALHGFSKPKDIVVTTPEAFLARREVPGTIERCAAREGRVLYATR